MAQQHGLNEVIEELKKRGIQAGQDEAERIVSEARKKADQIVAEAKAEAERVRSKARDDKAATLKALESEMAQAAAVGLAAFRQAIERGFLVPEIKEALEGPLAEPRFLEAAILEMVKAFAASGMKDSAIEVLLPEKRRSQLGAFFLAKLKARGAKGVEAHFDDGLAFGFRIGPKDGGFSFDLSDEGFQEIFVRFLSPRFRKAFYAAADETAEK